jgi:hypothetical protein
MNNIKNLYDILYNSILYNEELRNFELISDWGLRSSATFRGVDW